MRSSIRCSPQGYEFRYNILSHSSGDFIISGEIVPISNYYYPNLVVAFKTYDILMYAVLSCSLITYSISHLIIVKEDWVPSALSFSLKLSGFPRKIRCLCVDASYCTFGFRADRSSYLLTKIN